MAQIDSWLPYTNYYHKSEKHSVGRPKGEKSTASTSACLTPLLARPDRYLDKLEVETGISANRGTVMRNALKAFLDAKGY